MITRTSSRVRCPYPFALRCDALLPQREARGEGREAREVKITWPLEIAANLRITARTVAFHKYRIMAVLGAKNSIELLRFSEHQEPEPNERGSGS